MAEERIITPHRLNAFSDGVFAIAITLMVLTLRLPDEAAGIPIREVLRQTVPKLEIWVISFLIIGGFWIRHHKLIHRIERVDMVLLWLNLFYLLFITAMPWLVSLIETYPGRPLAVAIFSGSCGFLGLVKLSMWLYASHRGRLTHPSIPPREVEGRGALGPLHAGGRRHNHRGRLHHQRADRVLVLAAEGPYGADRRPQEQGIDGLTGIFSRAARLGEKIRAKDGVGRAVEYITKR